MQGGDQPMGREKAALIVYVFAKITQEQGAAKAIELPDSWIEELAEVTGYVDVELRD